MVHRNENAHGFSLKFKNKKQSTATMSNKMKQFHICKKIKIMSH